MSNFSVYSLHGNVNVGDTAIHLLVENGKTVRSAVLIDGGSNHGKSKYAANINAPQGTAITRMIEWINAQGWTFIDDATEAKLPCLKFTSIIITHWDEDHYAGVHTAVVDSWQDPTATDGPIPWIRWKRKEDQWVPCTALYCPNVLVNKAQGGNKLNGVPARFKVYPQDGQNFIAAVDSGNKKDFAEFFCAEADRWCVLGADFFSNNRLANKAEGPWTVQDMMKDNRPRPFGATEYPKGRPGMYGIGVWRRSLLKPKPGDPGYGLLDGTPDDMPGVIPDESVTMTNKVSIAAVCLWQTDTTPHCQCSHYFAGDADDNSEATWLTWLKDSGITRITNMKLSHHGSRSSSPLGAISLFEKFTPTNVVASAPSNKYFHPAWETILHFATCADIYSQQAGPGGRLPRFIATKAPFYFATVSTNDGKELKLIFSDPEAGNRSNRFNTEAFDGTSKDQEKFQNFIKSSGKSFENLFSTSSFNTEWHIYNEATDKQQKRQVLLKAIEGRWRTYGWPTLDANNTQAAHASIYPSAESSWETDFVIISHNSNPRDSYAYYKSLSGGSLVEIPPLLYQEAMDEEPAYEISEMAQLNENQYMWEDPPTAQNGEYDHGAYTFQRLIETGESWSSPFEEGTNPNEFLGDADYWYWDGDMNWSTLTGIPSVPTAPGPVLPGDGLVKPPSSGFFIYPTTIQEGRITAVADYAESEGHVHLSAESGWDWFARKLHTSVMRLQSKPKADMAPVAFHDNDELAHWIKLALQGASIEMMCKVDATETETETETETKFTFQEMDLAVPLKPGDKTSPMGTNFSTEPNNMAKVFGFNDVPSMNAAGMGSLGLRNSAAVLMFALRASTEPATNVVSYSVYDLASFVGFDSVLKNYPWTALLQALTLNMPDGTSSNQRNGIWFIPDMRYRTIARLQMDLDQTALGHIQDVLGVLGGSIQMTKCTAIARRTCTWVPGLKESKDYQATVEPQLALVAYFQLLKEYGFHAVIEFQKDHIQISLTLDFKSSDAIDKICAWLAEVSGAEPGNFEEFKSWFENTPEMFSGASWQFRRVTIDLVQKEGDDTAKPSLSFGHLSLDIEVCLNQKAEKSPPIYFLASFSYTPTAKGKWTDALALEAKLWLAPTFDPKDAALVLQPDYEDYKHLDTSGGNPLPTSLNLRDFDQLSSLPAWVPTNIEKAELILSKKQMAFSLIVAAIPPTGRETVPLFQISEVDLSFAYALDTKDFTAAMAITAILQPPTKTEDQFPVQLEGMVKYNGGNWNLSASVQNLTGLYISQFFDKAAHDSVLSLLKHISIVEFNINYDYEKTTTPNFRATPNSGESASSLGVKGQLSIGKFDLNIDYSHKGSSDWCFAASATKDKTDVSMTIGDIIEDLTGQPPDLPDFVSNISISIKGEKDGIGLAVMSSNAVAPPSKTATTAEDDAGQLFFTAYFEIGGILTQYIQLRPYKADKEAEAKGTNATKRLFVTALEALPPIEVPLIGNITRIFDEALFLWVEHPDGILKSELDTINKLLGLDQIKKPPIPFKSAKKEVADTDIVLSHGLHFLLVLKDEKGNPKCVIDYQFKSKKKPNDSQFISAAADAADEEPNQPSGMASYAKKVGPLSISNLGFSFANSTFSVMVDATVEIGPMEFQLVGFSLNMALGGDFDLHHLPIPVPDLKGLAISYDKSPLQIAGLLNHYKTETENMYQGALAAGFKAWQFSAAGCYGTVKQKKGEVEFPTAFFYCCLQGPLLSLPQAQITGVNGGFGYNSHLRLPAVDEVLQFPLMSPNGQYSSPMDAQTDFFFSKPAWITPQRDSFWVAAGLTAQAFKMLDIKAVIVVEWDPTVKLGLYGIASATVPFSAEKSVKFAFVQLGIAATVDFEAGTMQIAGQLTPASFIIHPDCHLTGGFAMYSWFGDKADIPNGWVFTIGGYHSSFKAPPQYPVVPRLGISWNLGPVSISGSAYFAITPAICMGGGTWNVSMVAGPLSAYYAAYIDFLINFQPFYFIADGGLSVGVKYSMDLWLVTIHISIDIAATIHLEGPPVHGVVHVNFWVFGFNVNFGESGSGAPGPLKLAELLSLVCEPGVPTKAASKAPELEADDDSSAFILSVEEGLVGSSDAKTPPNQPWTVRAATFAFSVTCKFAIYEATILTPNSDDPSNPTKDKQGGPPTPINARPMCLDKQIFQSSLTVTIEEGLTQRRLAIAVDENPDPVWTNNEAISKKLPSALWGPYDSSSDPTKHANNSQLLDGTRSDTSIDLLCGVRISRPDDRPSDEEALVPFQYVPFMISDVGKPRDGPVPDPVVTAFQPVEPDLPPRGPGGKPTRPSKQWSWVRQEWENPVMPKKSISVGQDVVDMWEKIAVDVMGWDPKKLGEKEPKLLGIRPKELIKDLENRYIRAPMVSLPQQVTAA